MKIFKNSLFIILCVIFAFNSKRHSTNIDNRSGAIRYICTHNTAEYQYASDNDLSQSSDEITKKLKDSMARAYGRTPSNSKIFIFKQLLLFSDTETGYFYQYSLDKPLSTPRVYQNFAKKIMVSTEKASSTTYFVEDEITPITWYMLNKTKKINNIECFSAQAQYRGRIWTAWYAPSIPISSGPWKLYGLPGIILEAEDKEGFVKYTCDAVLIPKPENFVLNNELILNKEKHINTKEYAIILEKSINNAEKMSATKEGKVSKSVSSMEIFDFEKNLTIKRFQQKLTDIPKK